MAYTTINKPSEYFDTKLYTQTGSTNNGDTQTITMDNVGMVWIKNRSYTNAHALFDIIRGGDKLLVTSSTGAEETAGGGLTFGASDTTIGADTGGYGFNNRVGDNYVGWHWRTDGTTGSSNTDGSITSTVSANTTSGFSIVSYTGTAANATVGHGLGVTPAMFIVKSRSSAGTSWMTWSKNFSSATDDFLRLNSSALVQTISNFWGTSAPNSTTFGVGAGGYDNNVSGATTIAYCFAEKKGFSKFGSYTGNGNANGTFVYTGFKPAFILVKSSSLATGWNILDNKRDTKNVMNAILQPSNSDAEVNDVNKYCDFLSNGFKWREGGGETNGNGATYIYMAFAENPLVGTNGIPATAR